MEFMKLDFLMLLQQPAHVGLGCCRFATLARFCRSLLLLDAATLGFSLSSQNLARPRDALFVLGSKCLGLLMLPLDLTTIGSSWSVRGSVAMTNSLAIHNYGIKCKRVQCESSLSVRSFMLFGSAFSPFQNARIGGILFALDHLHPDSIPFLKGHARFDSRLSAPDLLNLGSTSSMKAILSLEALLLCFDHCGIDLFTSLRSITKPDAALPSCGTARVEAPLLASDLGSPEAILILHSSARTEMVLSVWDHASLGSMLLSHSSS